MTDLDDQLDRACADGRISVGDADEVRTFAAFLRDVGGPPDGTPDRRRRFRDAWREHYPDDYARAVTEARGSREAPPVTGHEREARLATIDAHMGTYVRLRHETQLDYRRVTGWTLPAAWDPRGADETDVPALLMGVPVLFAGDRIVAHVDDGTRREADPDPEAVRRPPPLPPGLLPDDHQERPHA